MNTNLQYRNAERDCFCRVCNNTVKKGTPAVFWDNWRRSAGNGILCPSCVETIYNLLPKDTSNEYV
jgi:hypothetical protein